MEKNVRDAFEAIFVFLLAVIGIGLLIATPFIAIGFAFGVANWAFCLFASFC